MQGDSKHSEAVTILRPDSTVPIVASLPHSGLWIPEDLKPLFTDHHLQTLRNTDWHLDKLYSFLPDLGISVVRANFSRYVIDVNRPLQEPLFGPYQTSAIYQTNTWGEVIYKNWPYKNWPDPETFQKRIADFYAPYHQALEQVILSLNRHFGTVYLLDLHSFMGPIDNDICLGNANGQVRCENLLPAVQSSFSQTDFDVVLNKVFSGGHIIKTYGCLPYCEALQIELRYTVYLNHDELDRDIMPTYSMSGSGVSSGAGSEQQGFAKAQSQLRSVFSDIVRRLECGRINFT